MFYLVANGINFLLMKKIRVIMAILFFCSGKEKRKYYCFPSFLASSASSGCMHLPLSRICSPSSQMETLRHIPSE